ncbi:hypothetical protein RJT34_10222 [Clitoria ternatea]|uniref:FAS1 domain-containing protein n=1 Tax=Clitoria ternatea TaxID=43366 RepID=A0AAN9K7T3_CLITE
MNSSLFLCLVLQLAFSYCIHGLDITKYLTDYPEFNKRLTETKLVDKINGLKAVTILPFDDVAMKNLTGMSPEVVKAILSVHVLVDFYDPRKLVMEFQGPHTKIETLFQSSGLARGDQGYIYIGFVGEGAIAFASAVDTKYNLILMNSVIPEPGSVAILQVTQPFEVPGIEDSVGGGAGLTLGGMKKVDHAPIAQPHASSSSSSSVQMGLMGMALALASFFF